MSPRAGSAALAALPQNEIDAEQAFIRVDILHHFWILPALSLLCLPISRASRLA